MCFRGASNQNGFEGRHPLVSIERAHPLISIKLESEVMSNVAEYKACNWVTIYHRNKSKESMGVRILQFDSKQNLIKMESEK